MRFMAQAVIVWDSGTVPDLKGYAAANAQEGKSDNEIRVAMGDDFPSASTTRSYVLVLWSPTGEKVVGL